MPTPCPDIDTSIIWQCNNPPWCYSSPVLATVPVPSGSTSFSCQAIDFGTQDYAQHVVIRPSTGAGAFLASTELNISPGDTSSVFYGAIGVSAETVELQLYVFNTLAPLGNTTTGTVRITFNGSCDICEFGYRANPDVQRSIIITTVLIDEILFKVGRTDWAIIFDGFIGLLFVPGTICGGPPPALPNLQPCDLDPMCGLLNPDNFARFWRLFQAVAWYSVCECAPDPGGIITPTPPGVPTPPDPVPPVPVPVLPVCDNTNICSTLAVIQRQLVALASIATTTRAQVNLIQRQSVPFGYVTGPSHSALEGSGDFAVQGIIGLSVEYTSLPADFPPITGDPTTYHQIGKVSIGTARGWERSWMPTHAPYLILPIVGAITKVGYTFPAGIVATITELIREP